MNAVPSFEHEFLVELFRTDGALAVELLRTCAGITVEHARAVSDTADLGQIAPTEYRADAVIVLRGHDDRPVAGLIVEVQLAEDHDKRRSWPAYVVNLRAKLGCPTVLLVVAPAQEVAAWARRPIELGHPGFRLTPIVIGYQDVPRILDPIAASQLPELAVLSALAHPELEVATTAIEAIGHLPADQARLYLDVIMMALPAALRQHLEVRMQNYEYRSDFARKYYGQGRQEGRQEGLQEGREEGLQEGLRAAVSTLVKAKLELRDDELAALDELSDTHAMTELITALAQAGTAADARAALEHALRR